MAMSNEAHTLYIARRQAERVRTTYLRDARRNKLAVARTFVGGL